MIASLTFTRQYGRTSKVTGDVTHLPEFDEEGSTAYAHGPEDALKWLFSLPLYQDAIVEDLGDGRVIVTSKWAPYSESTLTIAWRAPELVARIDAKPTHTCERVMVMPRNTIYESTGYEAYRKDS